MECLKEFLPSGVCTVDQDSLQYTLGWIVITQVTGSWRRKLIELESLWTDVVFAFPNTHAVLVLSARARHHFHLNIGRILVNPDSEVDLDRFYTWMHTDDACLLPRVHTLEFQPDIRYITRFVTSGAFRTLIGSERLCAVQQASLFIPQGLHVPSLPPTLTTL